MANGLLDNIQGAWSFNFAAGNALDVAGDGGSGTANLYPFSHEAGATIGIGGFFVGGLAKGWGSDVANRMSFVDDVAMLFGPGDNSFTVGAWVRANRAANAPYLAKWDSTDATPNRSWLLWNRAGGFNAHRFSISSLGVIEETVIDINNPDATGSGPWQLVIAGYDSINEEIFMSLDGAAKITVAHTGGARAAAAVNLTPGWFQGTSHIGGSHDQDETFYWAGRVLTDGDCALIWNSGVGTRLSEWDTTVPTDHEDGSAIETGLVSYWDCTEASGETRVDSKGSNDMTEGGVGAPIDQGSGIQGVTASVLHADMSSNPGSLEFLEKASPVLSRSGPDSFTVAGFVTFDATAGSQRQTALSQWTNVGDQESFMCTLTQFNPKAWNAAISTDGTPAASTGVTDATDTYSLSGAPQVQRFLCYWYDGVADTFNLQVGNGPVTSVGSVTNVFDASTFPLKLGHAHNFGVEWALQGGCWSWGYWNRVLTQVEKNFIYHKGFGRLFTDLTPTGGFTATTYGFITQQLFLNRRR